MDKFAFIVPTGIGASIGGYAGDAGAYATCGWRTGKRTCKFPNHVILSGNLRVWLHLFNAFRGNAYRGG